MESINKNSSFSGVVSGQLFEKFIGLFKEQWLNKESNDSVLLIYKNLIIIGGHNNV